MPLIELSTALVAAGSSVVVPFVNKMLEKTASSMGDNVHGGLVKFFIKTHDNVIATGRTPQAVEPKVIVPVMQAVSLETDGTLIDHWAALLANAADPAQRVTVQPGFVEVLRQLTPTDARVLTHVYQQVPTDFGITNYSITQIQTTGFMAALELTQRAFAISIENLLRLRLCDTALNSKILPANSELPPPVAASVYPTIFGHEFLAAVTPPTI